MGSGQCLAATLCRHSVNIVLVMRWLAGSAERLKGGRSDLSRHGAEPPLSTISDGWDGVERRGPE